MKKSLKSFPKRTPKRLPFTFRYSVPPGLRKLPKDQKAKTPHYPLIPVRFYYNGVKLPVFEALLDSGADKINLTKKIVDRLNLPKCKKFDGAGMGGRFRCFETEVGLIIGRGGKEFDLGIVDAVCPMVERDVPILIGRYPVFMEYQVIFEDFKQRFKLITFLSLANVSIII